MGVRVGSFAMVGLGISCQANHQIGTHGALIRELTGSHKNAKHVRGPLDWAICPARSVARMIGDWRFYPADAADLVTDVTPYWPEGDCWFWHEGEHVASGEFASRQAHFVENLAALRALERVVFVICNTQTNLDEVARSVSRPLELAFTDEDIDAVEAASKAQFPNSELWTVVRKDRNRLQRRRRDPRVFEFEPDPSDWNGDYAQWAEAITRIMRSPA